MEQKPDILLELRELESSLSHSPGSTYQVPPAYFDGLPEWILARAKAADALTASEEIATLSPLLNSMLRQMPYAVPAGFFEELDPSFAYADDAVGEELAALSPLLGGLKKEMPFAVPGGYFDNLTPTSEVEKHSAKVIPLMRRSWVRIAAAAVVVAFVASTALFIGNRNSNNSDGSTVSVEKIMKKVSTAEIDDFVELAQEDMIASASTRAEIRELMKDVPEKDIQDFLNDAETSGSDIMDDLLLN